MNARLTLTAVCVVVFMLLLDMTIVAAALADIQASLHAHLSGLQWVVDAYALPMAGLLLTAATVGDRLGRRRLYLGGLVAFMFASAGCALARNIDVLNGLRAVQGSAGAVLLGVSLPMIAAAFPDARQRAGAIAAYGAAMGAGGAVGPLLGGALVTAYGWPSIFLINLPVGVLALYIVIFAVPESVVEQSRPVDVWGTAVLTAALFAGVYVLIEGNRFGWSSPIMLALSAFCVAALVAFGLRESRLAEPMLDVRLLAGPGFAGVSLAAFAASGTLIASTNYLALYFMNTLGFSPFGAGLRALPLTLAIVVGAPSAMVAARRIPVAATIPAGVALIAVGMWMMTAVNAHTTWTHFIAGSVVAGLGLGALSALTSDAALRFVPVTDAGMATGTVSTARQIGILAGVAGLGALFSRHAGDLATARLSAVPGLAVEPARQLSDGLAAGAGLRALAVVPDRLRPALAAVAREAGAAGMQAALTAAAVAATASTVVVVVLVRMGARQTIYADTVD
ncbi:putative drug resistance transporter [Mycolicibacterium aubagnense]|uniref:Drug resistance transporter n=1 Tax=Mycolicibacterium aubagnense TaxID=319707 RepID=A0ABM7IHH0_9MYCO|nr:putative drug resistance transporter [Mycolicibacterium aubagnense]